MKIMPKVTFEYHDDELKSAFIQPINATSNKDGFHIVLPSNKSLKNSLPSAPVTVKKNFLEKSESNTAGAGSLVVNDKYKYIETMEKHIKSMYVLNFVQNEEIFDYLKSLAEEEESKKQKISKYLHMIIENPRNRKESLEVGLKVVDLTINYGLSN